MSEPLQCTNIYYQKIPKKKKNNPRTLKNANVERGPAHLFPKI